MKVYIVTSELIYCSTHIEGIFDSFSTAEKYVLQRLEKPIDDFDRFANYFSYVKDNGYWTSSDCKIYISEHIVRSS